MNLTNLGFWFRGFFEVIIPNYFTLAMVVATILIFFIMKAVYGRTQVREKNAMHHVGRRWQWVGYIMILVMLLIYAGECIYVYTAKVAFFKNQDRPEAAEMQNLVRATEIDMANIEKIHNEKKRDAALQSYKIREELTIAEANKIKLERKFSDILSSSILKKFYKDETNRDTKLRVRDLLKKQLNYKAGEDNDKVLQDAVTREFTVHEYKDVLNDLKNLIKKEFESKVGQNEKEMRTPYGDFNSFKEMIIRDKKVQTNEIAFIFWECSQRLNKVFKQTINVDSKVTYTDLVSDLKTCIEVHLKNRTRDVMSEMDVNKIIDDVNKDNTYKSEEEKIGRLWKLLTEEFKKKWRGKNFELDKIFADHEYLLYRNDKVDLFDIRKNHPDMLKLNNSFDSLLKHSCWLKNLFYFIVFLIIVFIIFIARGKQICDLGNVQKIKNKIKG